MLQKTKEQVQELFVNIFEVRRRGVIDARPTVPGEAIVAENFSGQIKFTENGYVVTEDKKKFYYEPAKFNSMFEAVVEGPEGPGGARTYRYKGRFKATRYGDEPFLYRTSTGTLEVVKSNSYIIDFFDDFLFADEIEFRKNYCHV
jgi:hypothetical protein